MLTSRKWSLNRGVDGCKRLHGRRTNGFDEARADGATLAAGAVCTVRRVRNPVTAARAVLDSGRAVLLAGAAADDFAASQGLAMVQPDYFTTQRRVEAIPSGSRIVQPIQLAIGAVIP